MVVLLIMVLGIAAGALLAEATVLVPFWRALAPRSFLAWYRDNATILMRFFAPLEIVAALLALAAAITAWVSTGSPVPLLNASCLMSILVLVAFPVYFKRANSNFAAGTIEPDRVADELRRWARWHWARVVIATAAFLAAVLAGSMPAG